MKYQNIRRGFTLIELLVVVLIIGILAAAAVPQYQKVIERSKAAEAITLLSSIAKAYQVYYLANGKYATKFAELDVDIPFTGNTKVMEVNNNTGDTKSSDDWSFEIQEHSSSSGYISLFATRIDGKYKGAGFYVSFKTLSNNQTRQLNCFERTSSARIVFDTELPEGAYCERVMQAQKITWSPYARNYILP